MSLECDDDEVTARTSMMIAFGFGRDGYMRPVRAHIGSPSSSRIFQMVLKYRSDSSDLTNEMSPIETILHASTQPSSALPVARTIIH